MSARERLRRAVLGGDGEGGDDDDDRERQATDGDDTRQQVRRRRAVERQVRQRGAENPGQQMDRTTGNVARAEDRARRRLATVAGPGGQRVDTRAAADAESEIQRVPVDRTRARSGPRAPLQVQNEDAGVEGTRQRPVVSQAVAPTAARAGQEVADVGRAVATEETARTRRLRGLSAGLAVQTTGVAGTRADRIAAGTEADSPGLDLPDEARPAQATDQTTRLFGSAQVEATGDGVQPVGGSDTPITTGIYRSLRRSAAQDPQEIDGVVPDAVDETLAQGADAFSNQVSDRVADFGGFAGRGAAKQPITLNQVDPDTGERLGEVAGRSAAEIFNVPAWLQTGTDAIDAGAFVAGGATEGPGEVADRAGALAQEGVRAGAMVGVAAAENPVETGVQIGTGSLIGAGAFRGAQRVARRGVPTPSGASVDADPGPLRVGDRGIGGGGFRRPRRERTDAEFPEQQQIEKVVEKTEEVESEADTPDLSRLRNRTNLNTGRATPLDPDQRATLDAPEPADRLPPRDAFPSEQRYQEALARRREEVRVEVESQLAQRALESDQRLLPGSRGRVQGTAGQVGTSPGALGPTGSVAGGAIAAEGQGAEAAVQSPAPGGGGGAVSIDAARPRQGGGTITIDNAITRQAVRPGTLSQEYQPGAEAIATRQPVDVGQQPRGATRPGQAVETTPAVDVQARQSITPTVDPVTAQPPAAAQESRGISTTGLTASRGLQITTGPPTTAPPPSPPDPPDPDFDGGGPGRGGRDPDPFLADIDNPVGDEPFRDPDAVGDPVAEGVEFDADATGEFTDDIDADADVDVDVDFEGI